jgi:penicillin-binding protein 1A
MTSRWWFYPALIGVSWSSWPRGFAALTVVLLWPNLPSLEVLTDYRPKIPLRVYSAENELIGEYGEEKRAVVKIKDVPQVMKAAILAAEDDRFYQHGGVDYTGVVRAAVANLQGRREGASTITMQVARTFFLTREKTFAAKLSEVLLAFKIEANLTKDQILELYINQIFLGQRRLRFRVGGQRLLRQEPERAHARRSRLLAGLPQAPSRQNPFVNPKRAQERQQYVLRRMRDVGWLSEDQYKKSVAEPLRLNPNKTDTFALKADYVAEMARVAIFEQFGEPAYVSGLRVYTTIKRKDQEAANESIRAGIMEYDRRHGYRGPEGYHGLPDKDEQLDDAVEEALQDREKRERARCRSGAGGLAARSARDDAPRRRGEGERRRAQVRRPGAGDEESRPRHPPRLHHPAAAGDKGGWSISQVPRVEAALVALDPSNGAVQAPGRRLRLQREQVQPRDAGLAPAGLELQAVHLFGGSGEGLHAGHGAERRALRDRRGEDRRPALGAEELRRQVRRPDAASHRARQVEEHGVDPPAAGDRPGLRAGLHPALRLRPEDAPGLPHHGVGRGLGHAAADGGRLLDLRQRRLQG